MNLRIERYTKDKINDVLEFERELRRQEENTYYWEIYEQYVKNVKESFDSPDFVNTAISLLAYKENRVIGRVDASIVKTHFDGTIYDAYLNWICVLKNERHNGVAQLLLQELRQNLKARKIDTLIALTAENEESTRFYDSVEDKKFCRGIMIEV